MKLDFGTLLFGVAAGFLVFLAGSLMMLTEAFPSGYIRDAYRGGTALYDRTFRYRDRYATDLWVRARTEARGVTVLDPERVYDGLTLYTSGHAAQALLIDLHGDIVHVWERPYSTVWERDRSAVRRPVPDTQIFFRKARVLPGGDLLALYEGVGDTPYGYGMVRLTRDSEVTWTNLANLHHDFDVTPDGRIVTLGHSFRHTPLRGADQFEPPYIEDFLVMLDADGETVLELSLLDAVNESAYRQFLWRVPYYSMEDPLHANAVDYLDAEKAAWLAQRVPVAAEGQVLVSFREMAGGSLALVDPQTGAVVWAARGPWLAQHDPDVLPGGTIQVFDNRGDLVGPGKSRIVEVDPATGGVVWEYGGSADNPLDSPIRAEQERQPNGNTLITESGGGRLLEVTRDGTIVWEYINPIRGGEQGEMIPVVAWGQRVPYGELDLAADAVPGPVHDGLLPEEVAL
jgi:hypothetical protein